MIEAPVVDRLHKLVGVAWIKLFWFLAGRDFFGTLAFIAPVVTNEDEELVFRLESLDDAIDNLIDARAETIALPLADSYQWLLDIALDLKPLVSELVEIDTSVDYTDRKHFDALSKKVADIYFTHQKVFLLAQDKLEILTGGEGLTDWAAAITELANHRAVALSPDDLSADINANIRVIPSEQVQKIGWKVIENGILVRVYLNGKAPETKVVNRFADRELKQLQLLKLMCADAGRVPIGNILEKIYPKQYAEFRVLKGDEQKKELARLNSSVKSLKDALNKKVRAEILIFNENLNEYQKSGMSFSAELIDLEHHSADLRSRIPSKFRKGFAAQTLQEAEIARREKIEAILPEIDDK